MAVSRVPLSSLPNGTILISGSYTPAVGATAYVYEHGTTKQVVIYAAEVGSSTLTQPLAAGTSGQLPGYILAEQDIDVVATYSGHTAEPAEGVALRAEDLVGVDPTTGAAAVGLGSVPLPGSVVSGSSTSAPVFVAPNPSGGDDAAPLNTFVAALPSSAKVLWPGKEYKLNTTSLVLNPSGPIEHDFGNAKFTSPQGMGKPLFVNKARTPVVAATDVTTVAESAVITSASIAAVAVAGQQVIIPGAGAGSVSPFAPLLGTVVSVAGSNVTLDTAAGHAVGPNANGSLITRDADLKIKGGRWYRTDTAAANSDNTNLVCAYIAHCDRLDVGSPAPYFNSTNASGYGLRVGNIADSTIAVRADTHSDGLHLQGNCFRVKVDLVDGSAQDNILAIGGRDYNSANNDWEETSGNISDIDVRGVFMKGAKPVAVWAGDGTTVQRITVQGIYGTVAAGFPVVQSITYEGQPQITGGVLDDATFRDVRAQPTGAAPIFQLYQAGIKRFKIRDVYINTTNATHMVDTGHTGATIDLLDIRGYEIEAWANGASVVNVGAGTINRLGLSHGQVVFSNGSQAIIIMGVSTGVVNKCRIDGLDIEDSAGAQLVYNPAAGATLSEIRVSNLRASGMAWVLDLNTTTTLLLANANLSGLISGFANLRASASLTLFAANGNSTSPVTAVFNTTAGYQLRVNGLFPSLDISKINNPADGDIVHNSNGALGCGTGPATFNSTAGKWKGLYSGLTT